MKQVLACISFVAVTTTAALCATTPAAKPTAKPAVVKKASAPIKVAPADEYFGKLKMSVLGIRNTIKDVGANIEIDQTRWVQQASKASFAEDAVHDWERKYPKDTWLAKTLFALERMYAKLDSDEGRRRSLATMQWLTHDFPATWYGRTGKKELAAGKVGHPVVAAASPSPSPSAGGEAVAAPYPEATGSAVMGAESAPSTGTVAPDVTPVSARSSPSPSPSPSASPVSPASPSPGTP